MAEPAHKHGIDRRGFVAGVVTLLGAIISVVIGLPGIGYLLSPALEKSKRSSDNWVPLGLVEDIPENEPTLFTFTQTRQVGWERTAKSFGVYVVKKPGGEYDTFSNICTHLSCRVSWKPERESYVCPCHDGIFAKDGGIISGPQPRPLDKFENKIEDGTISVLVEEI